MADLLVTLPGPSSDEERAHEVLLYYGPISGPATSQDADAVFSLEGETGFSISSGDLNHDGIDDAIIGAPTAITDSCEYGGAVYVFFGPLQGTYTRDQADARLFSAVALDQAGDAVSSGGDVNGDGIDGLLVGAPHHQSTCQTPYSQDEPGHAYLLFGPLEGERDLATADVVMSGEYDDDEAGRSVSIRGDLDGDGRDEVVIGAPSHDTYVNPNRGSVYVLYSSHEPRIDLNDSDAGIEGDSRVGASVAAADTNGDGYDDLLTAGSLERNWSGSAFMFFGGPRAP